MAGGQDVGAGAGWRGAHLGKEWKILTRFKVCFQIPGTPQEQVGTEEGMVHLILAHVAGEADVSAEHWRNDLLDRLTYYTPPHLPLHHQFQDIPPHCQGRSHHP